MLQRLSTQNMRDSSHVCKYPSVGTTASCKNPSQGSTTAEHISIITLALAQTSFDTEKPEEVQEV